MSPSAPYVRPGDSLEVFLRSFWQRQITTAEEETPDFRHPALPLARIKKVMKSDPDVKMIAADAPILFCKACEIFIAEMTARAFIIADSNKRRTLSRSDIAKALAKSDQFDFLIDIVPREEALASSDKTVAGGRKPATKRKPDIHEPATGSSISIPTQADEHQGQHLDLESSLLAFRDQQNSNMHHDMMRGQGDAVDQGVILLQSLLNPPSTSEGGL